MLKLALIIGSTRPQRFADTPANWIVEGAAARDDFSLEVLDLRDQNLPFFEEPMSPLFTGGAFSHPAAEAWRHKLAKYDGFIVTAAEYNHGPTAALKNAFDSAFNEWRRKPVAFVGYGGVGGARAIEQLRGTAIELHMAPIKAEVNISMEPFLGILMQGKKLDDYDYLVASRGTLFDEIAWWANALKAAREA
ncbi:NAD(P)H-dependent oxidoreductase [Sphingomonas sp. JC676]|uniref:NADPH-dependent FMN reductase n=1 Tax=Sphingomonas sp. JC676 TaxID=2768065 RepID=UPI00165771AA|nr:NAD(P)H-dependent oxidoreductase [Sphingomonas sp. JC676]MBC9033512.1 NAD(P)H-dependent oxidoreductase [Sphingomonas sp. JC676]